MPIDSRKLVSVLKEMKTIYLRNPANAVRSSKFINKLHDYSAYELKKCIKTSEDIEIKPEAKIYGAHKPKKVDVAVIQKDNGPILGISLKSQMNSIAKNFVDRYENALGDATGLHEKFPFLVLGMLYLLPLKTIGARTVESPNFEKIEKYLSSITEREDWDARTSKYEHFALLIVDFNKNPPKIVTTIPSEKSLKIDDFFDKLMETYQNRNPHFDIRR